MGLSFKSIGRGLKKVASIANPIFGAGYDAIAGKGLKTIGKNVVSNYKTGAKGALAVAPLALSGGAAAPLLGAAGGGGASLLSAGGALGALKGVGKFALENPELIAGGLSALEGHDAARKADRYRGKALAAAEQQYADAAPLRKAGMAGMLAAGPDLSSAFQSSNPMARTLKKVPR